MSAIPLGQAGDDSRPLGQAGDDSQPMRKAGDHSQPLVKASGISKVFDVSPPWLNRVIERKPRMLLHAVDEVSFEIARGETLALVGESGCGKSTVARMLVGLYTPSRGSVQFDSQDLSVLGSRAGEPLRRRLQMIFQDPYASLNPRWKVADIVSEPIRVHRLIANDAGVRARVTQLLGHVGLAAADAEKFPHQFSGGQRQRISIARALASESEFLVCDEPTSALDVSVQAQVLNLMRELQREHGLTYLFISHNLAVVHHVSDRVGVMYLGRIVEIAPKRELFERPRHPYTRMLLDAIPDVQMTGKARTPVAGEVPNPLSPPSGCTFHPRCPHANDRCRQERPELRPPPADLAETVAEPRIAMQGAIRAVRAAAAAEPTRETSVARVACHAVEERRIAFTSV